MARKNYSVRFVSIFINDNGKQVSFANKLKTISNGNKHLPEHSCEGDGYQIRDLVEVGSVFKGAFARLRHDAPHKITAKNEERLLDLDEGDRILHKVHFVYHSDRNILSIQYDRSLATTNKLQVYLCGITKEYVSVIQCMNTAEIDAVLSKNLYEIEYSHKLPKVIPTDAPVWSKSEFTKMKSMNAAIAKLVFRADRGDSLSNLVKGYVRNLLSDPSAGKVKVRVTDDTDPISLFAAPITESFSVELLGNYPDPDRVYEELEAAYTRKDNQLPQPI